MALTKAERKLLAKLGSKGGKQTRKNLTAEQRTAVARNAANSRWAKRAAAESSPEAAA